MTPLQIEDNTPTQFPNPDYTTLTNWKRGVISLLDKSRLPQNALEEATNIFLYEVGNPGPRPGVNWFGTASPNEEPWDGFDYYDADGDVHLVGVAGGVVYRSTDDGTTWDACSGATLTADTWTSMNQNGSYLYLTNGVDNIVRYDGSTTLVTYGTLATPAAPTVAETSLAGTNYNYYYKVSRVNEVGFSVASDPSTVVQADLNRTDWGASNYATVTTPNGVAGQTRWDIYISEDDLNYFYVSSVTATESATSAWVDNGTAIIIPSTLAPTESTAQGPLVEELVNVGSRQYGVRDTSNRYRIWFTGGTPFSGAFSTAYDGGYLDWQEGGKYIPVHVEDYRDGKGDPVATIWCKSADGQGCILQMTLDEVTVDDVTVLVPAAYKLPGSRGTPAPGSVVNVLNDYMFYNSQAFYNLGSRAQFLNILSTDEASANIRPDVKQINTVGEANIASVYFDARVFFSVPYGSTENNATIVFDTERKAWLPTAFDIGFKKFLRYTDTTGVQRLLAMKPGDNRLSEISSQHQGDYGEAFMTILRTGLYSTNRNRAEFQFVEQGEFEFSNPQGAITIELLGSERSRGFQSNKTATVEAGLSRYGWDSFLWDSTLWDDTTNVEEPFGESSVWRYFTIQRELRNVQWAITTNSLDANYILRTLQTWGTPTQGGLPRQERLT